jgi:hypothetical protein
MLKILEKKPIGNEQEEIEFYSCFVKNDSVGTDEPQQVILHKDEVGIYELLGHLQKSLNLYPGTIKEIWGVIEKYGDFRRNEKILSAIKEALSEGNKQ